MHLIQLFELVTWKPNQPSNTLNFEFETKKGCAFVLDNSNITIFSHTFLPKRMLISVLKAFLKNLSTYLYLKKTNTFFMHFLKPDKLKVNGNAVKKTLKSKKRYPLLQNWITNNINSHLHIHHPSLESIISYWQL